MTGAPDTIEHAGILPDLPGLPAFVAPDGPPKGSGPKPTACSYCGVGDAGFVVDRASPPPAALPLDGVGVLEVSIAGTIRSFPARARDEQTLVVETSLELCTEGGYVQGVVVIDGQRIELKAKEIERSVDASGGIEEQVFERLRTAVRSKTLKVVDTDPTGGCVKLRTSAMRQGSAYPIHIQPSALVRGQGRREALGYEQAIERLAELVLDHRRPGGRTLVYASGQIDYFTIFAMQEVLRLLGVRNLTGNAEHCLNAGAVHNEVLTGQEGPFMTIPQALEGPGRFYLLNGWNGRVSHPPVYRALLRRPDFDGVLVEVMVTETAKGVARKLGAERVVLVRPGSDPHLALGVIHRLLRHHPSAIDRRFIERFSDAQSFLQLAELALTDRFETAQVARRIAPEPEYVERIAAAIELIAAKLADPEIVPINLPSVGLSQSTGIVAHCLWGSALASVGKFGLAPDGTPRGGVVRIPGQINAESEVQGLSRKSFLGRIPMADADEAAARMGLPAGAYQRALDDEPRAALDYSDPTPGTRELLLCFGTQLEANMPNRPRWLAKLHDPDTTVVVVDPIPGPWATEHAVLIVPSPPHPAVCKLYQNGEWRLSLSVPNKQAPAQTRSDATILYDLMAAVVDRIDGDPEVAAAHPDLAGLLESGYLRPRFCDLGAEGGLRRLGGEVSRPQLWARVQSYLHGGRGPLYCSFDDEHGEPISWERLLAEGSIVYGGVGTHRFVLDYDDPRARPFRDIYREPGAFRFFLPTEHDLRIPEGIIFNSGRSSLSDERGRIHFATATFNSGKATPVVGMPDEHPLHVGPGLAEELGLAPGQWLRVSSPRSEASIDLPVVVSDRVKGRSVYVSFHRSAAQDGRGLFINEITDHEGRCPYSSQVKLKTPSVLLRPIEPPGGGTG